MFEHKNACYPGTRKKTLTLKNEQIMSERYFPVKIHLNKATVNEFLINEAKIMNEISVK